MRTKIKKKKNDSNKFSSLGEGGKGGKVKGKREKGKGEREKGKGYRGESWSERGCRKSLIELGNLDYSSLRIEYLSSFTEAYPRVILSEFETE